MQNFFKTIKSISVGVLLLALSIGSFQSILQNPNYQKSFYNLSDLFASNFDLSVLTSNTPDVSSDVQGNAQDAVTKVSPAVVSIYGTKDIPQGFGFLQEISAGTGFFVDSDGYLVTNKHVVSEDQANYSVVLSSGKKKRASVIYKDPNTDLALLKIDGSDYPVLNLADSSKLKIGQTVLGIGNAFGKSKKIVSEGAISNLNKTIVTVGDSDSSVNGQRLRHIIESTAQLYPGDSGGPLFDLSGNVVGVNVAIAQDQDNQSFSIPINDVKRIITQQIQ